MSNKLNPIIFIPGLMGSIGGEMLGCKKGWGFGVASFFYKPFIKELGKLGYRLNKDLFICYYDWRKNCNHIVGQYLLPLLIEVGEKHPNQKIDLFCHSMGGLVGRTYIQDRRYSYNIRNLMIWGTPNKGSVEAYYLWSMGEIMNNKENKENQLFEIIRRGYIWLLTKILDIPLGKNNVEKLHENFQGLRDLLPTYDYRYVLAYKDKNNNYVYIPTEYIKYKNKYINSLNKNIDILHSRIKETYCFIGTNKETEKTLIVDKKALFNNKDENIINSLKTKNGDGTVTVKSASIDKGNIFLIEGSHSGILVKSIKYIANIYKIDESLIKLDIIEPKGYPLGIILKKYIHMELKNKKELVGRFVDSKFISKYEFIIEEFGRNYIWIMLKDIPEGEYILEALVDYKKDYDIFLVGRKIEEELTYKNIKKMDNNRIEFYFKV